jgi:hypothetical protein
MAVAAKQAARRQVGRELYGDEDYFESTVLLGDGVSVECETPEEARRLRAFYAANPEVRRRECEKSRREEFLESIQENYYRRHPEDVQHPQMWSPRLKKLLDWPYSEDRDLADDCPLLVAPGDHRLLPMEIV